VCRPMWKGKERNERGLSTSYDTAHNAIMQIN